MKDDKGAETMEKAEISRLINSFNAIKGYFDTTTKYMPHISKLVVFIEDVVPLLNTIHNNLHQSSSMIPTATEKLGKVTSATEMAATEVMDIVDNVIERLNTIGASVQDINTTVQEKSDTTAITQKTAAIQEQVDGCQDDLFSIMNALQFQDITTQQINSIASTIDTVQHRLHELLQGFEDDGIELSKIPQAAFDPDAEFDFDRSAMSQKMADEFLKNQGAASAETGGGDTLPAEDTGNEQEGSGDSAAEPEASREDNADIDDSVIYGADGQPDISSILKELNSKDDSE